MTLVSPNITIEKVYATFNDCGCDQHIEPYEEAVSVADSECLCSLLRLGF